MRENVEVENVQTQKDTADPMAAIRNILEASSDGGQGSMLKAFKTFRRKADSLDNKIDFEEFAHGPGHPGAIKRP